MEVSQEKNVNFVFLGKNAEDFDEKIGFERVFCEEFGDSVADHGVDSVDAASPHTPECATNAVPRAPGCANIVARRA
ncbi:hypothetical protein HAX54_033599, partial [Datura stramonium]|nr:hypothetical protein [Datura stramonium]